MSEDDRRWAIGVAKCIAGARDAHHLVDLATGNRVWIPFFDDEIDVTARAPETARQDLPHSAPKSETIHQVIGSD